MRAVFIQLERVDGDQRAKGEGADARVIGERARSRPERGVPLALHRLFDVLGACLGAEDARALQADRRARYAGVRHETIGPQAPVQRAFELAGADFIGVAAVAVLAAEIGDRAAEIADIALRSEEHTSELQSLMRISYAAFCLKKKN